MALEYNCIDICNNTPTIAKKVDFVKMKNSGVEYVIFRAIRRRLIVDESFEIYYKGAREAGLKIGVYLYSYAGCNQTLGAKAELKKNWSTKTCVDYAKKEAEAVLKLLNGRKLELPVFYDLEERAQAEVLKSAYINRIAEGFKKVIEAGGYEFGLYCDQDYYNSYIDKNKWKDTPTWIAKYSSPKPTCCKDNLIAWQYKGTVSGVGLPTSLKCDRSHWYGMKKKATNTKPIEPVKEEAKTTNEYETKSVKAYKRIINCTSINIRTGPASSYKSIGTYKADNIVYIIEDAYKNNKANGWGRTDKGWIYYKKYSANPVGKITVICKALNMRSTMDSKSKTNIKYVAKKGEVFTVMDIKKASDGSSWYYLANGFYCVLNDKFTKLVK